MIRTDLIKWSTHAEWCRHLWSIGQLNNAHQACMFQGTCVSEGGE